MNTINNKQYVSKKKSLYILLILIFHAVLLNAQDTIKKKSFIKHFGIGLEFVSYLPPKIVNGTYDSNTKLLDQKNKILLGTDLMLQYHFNNKYSVCLSYGFVNGYSYFEAESQRYNSISGNYDITNDKEETKYSIFNVSLGMIRNIHYKKMDFFIYPGIRKDNMAARKYTVNITENNNEVISYTTNFNNYYKKLMNPYRIISEGYYNDFSSFSYFLNVGVKYNLKKICSLNFGLSYLYCQQGLFKDWYDNAYFKSCSRFGINASINFIK